MHDLHCNYIIYIYIRIYIYCLSISLRAYYEDSAFLRNELATSKMFLELRKINELKFQYNFTGLDMMSWSEATLQLSGIICAEDSGTSV